MAVDLRINSIQANVTSVDVKLAENPEFIAKLAQAVRVELERENRIRSQRAVDQAPRTKRRL